MKLEFANGLQIWRERYEKKSQAREGQIFIDASACQIKNQKGKEHEEP